MIITKVGNNGGSIIKVETGDVQKHGGVGTTRGYVGVMGGRDGMTRVFGEFEKTFYKSNNSPHNDNPKEIASSGKHVVEWGHACYVVTNLVAEDKQEALLKMINGKSEKVKPLPGH